MATLTDLTKSNGRCLDPNKLNGTFSLLSSRTRGISIHQERPSDVEWGLWKRANKLWSHPSGKLKQPLGAWLLAIHSQKQQHRAYESSSEIWIRTDDGYVKCNHIGSGVYKETTHFCKWDALPTNAAPLQVRGKKDPRC